MILRRGDHSRERQKLLQVRRSGTWLWLLLLLLSLLRLHRMQVAQQILKVEMVILDATATIMTTGPGQFDRLVAGLRLVQVLQDQISIETRIRTRHLFLGDPSMMMMMMMLCGRVVGGRYVGRVGRRGESGGGPEPQQHLRGSRAGLAMIRRWVRGRGRGSVAAARSIRIEALGHLGYRRLFDIGVRPGFAGRRMIRIFVVRRERRNGITGRSRLNDGRFLAFGSCMMMMMRMMMMIGGVSRREGLQTRFYPLHGRQGFAKSAFQFQQVLLARTGLTGRQGKLGTRIGRLAMVHRVAVVLFRDALGIAVEHLGQETAQRGSFGNGQQSGSEFGNHAFDCVRRRKKNMTEEHK